MKSMVLICCLFCVPALYANQPGDSPAQTSMSKKSSTPRSGTWTGWATWYSVASCRAERWGTRQPLMANGKPMRDAALTCALPWKPDGRHYRVTMRTGSSTTSVVVVHADRGPGKRALANGVCIDLTPMAMRLLAGSKGIRDGRVRVTVEEI